MNQKRSAALSFIFITILIDVIGLGIIIPVLPKLIEKLIGGNLSDASVYGGWLTFAYAIMQFIFSPVVGALSDKFGRRPILLFSMLGLGIDYIFMAYAPTIAWLFVGRIIAGVTGASFTTATAYIADISEPSKRAQNFGLVGAAFGIGFIIGPVMGGIFSQWGERVPFLLAACFSLLNFLYGFFVLPESLTKEHRRPFEWKRANPLGTLLQLKNYPVVYGLVISILFLHLAGHAVQSNWSFFTMFKFNWSEADVGYSLGYVGVMIAIVQGGLIRVIIPKLGQKKSLYVGLGLNGLGLLLFAFASQGWMMYAFLIPYALGGIAGPALQGIMSNQVPDNSQGELQGALTGLMSVTMIVGPIMMNSIFAYFTRSTTPFYFPGAPFIAATILIVLSIVFAIGPMRRFIEKK